MGELFSQDEIDKVIDDIKPYWRDDVISREAVISITVECNGDCEHCHWWNEPQESEELNREEIAALLASESEENG